MIRRVGHRYFSLPPAGRGLIQGFAVVLCATAGSFVVGHLRFGSPLNLVWAVLIPAMIGILFNRGTTNRIVTAVGWIVVSLLTMALLVIPAGLGPS